ncbi:MAG: bifunctional DNA-formamidopyrimidine glycosylase/DNA-(apurinic or apyrimidinic site) lyase [Pseudomonadota bacterium]
MPELPEVETSRRGIAPWMENRRITAITVRDRRLRWPVPDNLEVQLTGQTIVGLKRRAKYLLIETGSATALLHLGMSGSLRIIDPGEPAGKHDHVDIAMDNGKALRFRDPRRFGSLLLADDPAEHPLLKDLGPEPLADTFDGDYLWRKARGRRVAVKPFIMSANVVVGVGNIYASEALFLAGVHPKRAAGRISKERMTKIADAIKTVLTRAIKAGGTTLRDFHGGDGEPGYFRQKLSVYGRDEEACRQCGAPIAVIVLGQRSTYYCKHCQR